MKKCTCGRVLFGKNEVNRGRCSTCEVATWPQAKKDAMGKLIGACLRGENDKIKDFAENAIKYLNTPVIPPATPTESKGPNDT